jgi:hypothetical protein
VAQIFRVLVRKTPLFAPFVYKNDHFTKTGSGQTWGKHSKKVSGVFLRCGSAGSIRGGVVSEVSKNGMFGPLFDAK